VDRGLQCGLQIFRGDVSRNERRLRDELRWLRSRYDGGKVSPAVFAVIRDLETEIAWRQHAQQESRCR
jgi:hypothetical protein